MKSDLKSWSEKLQHHADKCRKYNPVHGTGKLSSSQKTQYYIIKGSLPDLLNRLPVAKASTAGSHYNLEYPVVFTSNAAGLAAARDPGQRFRPFFSLYPEELNLFFQIHPDLRLKNYVHIWSHFLEKPDELITALTGPYPLGAGEKYWLHVEGMICGPHQGRGAEHLWSWDGNRPKLLKKNFRHWAS